MVNRKGLGQANILRTNNNTSTGYGIAYADEVSGHRTVANLTALYALNDWQLSASGDNTDNDAIGQLWYVVNADGNGNGCYYQLKDWSKRNEAAGWSIADYTTKAELQDKIDNIATADEEDITTEGDTPQTQVLKLKDRAYDSLNASGKGYKILRKNWQSINGERKNVLTQEMINEPNTIYEIRYDFDLNGAEITVPENCVLKFNGGHLKYKDIIVSTDTLCGKEIGMIPNTDDQGISASNYKKLVNFINLGFHIIIDDVYYIYTTSDIITADNLIITGKGSISKLFCKNFGNGVFVIKNNIDTISIKDITIDTDVPLARANIFVNIKQSGPLFIKNVNIENCSSRNIRIFSYFGEDIDMSTGNTGIHSINVRNCNINETVMYFVASDVPIDYIHIEGVKVTNLYGTLFSLATTNGYTNQSSGFCDKLIINDCFVENTYIFEDEVAYLSFVVAEFKNIYYYNNLSLQLETILSPKLYSKAPNDFLYPHNKICYYCYV